MRGFRLKTLACLLVCVLALQLCGCESLLPAEHTAAPAESTEAPAPSAPAVGTVDLMAAVVPNQPQPRPISDKAAAAAADFSLRLFRTACESDGNCLLAPLSVLCALSMTLNGAEGETLAQMEQTLGLSREDWNEFFRSWLESCSGEGTLKIANSVWFSSAPSLSVRPEFLQTNADFYGAEVYRAPFDESTLADINTWVKDKTDGKIPEILDRIPQEAVMYLINALAFDARWEQPYSEDGVAAGTFRCADGTRRSVEYLYSEETRYLETETATGFLKPYAGGKYAFAALLPNKELSPADCLASLDGESLRALLTEPQTAELRVGLPKFESSFSAELSELLRGMGMKLAFAPAGADFSGLGSSTAGNLYISRVLHKTFLSVAEDGTRAGAASAVEISEKGLSPEQKQLQLDRPFLYMLLDTETGVPFFIGVLQDPAR